MLAVVYLLGCLLVGFSIVKYFVPEVFYGTRHTYEKKSLEVSPVMLWLPVCWITGILLVTWGVYIFGYIFSDTGKPLVFANVIAFVVFGILGTILFVVGKKKGKKSVRVFSNDRKSSQTEMIGVLLGILFASVLMFYSFYVGENNQLYIGNTIFGDFSPHLSMVRSFSKGNNFPTWYTFYSGIDVKYHFMFLFLVGNLEFLGMRIDYAFNVPSIMGMVFLYMLLYVLTVKVSGKRKAGAFAVLFFNFRSGSSLLGFLADIPAGESVWTRLKENTEYIGNTPNENWGLYQLNVYINQRHLAICLAVLVMVLILVLPYLYKTFDRWNKLRDKGEESVIAYVKATFFEKKAWELGSWKKAVFIGFISGASAFWNGATLIGLLIVLFFVAAFSRKRLDFVVIAGIAGGMALLQSKVFMQESSLVTTYRFGYLAENPTIWGVMSFLIRLMGVLLIVLVAAFLYYRGTRRYLTFVFATPLIFAFTVCMTTDINVNHKYVLVSFLLLNVIAATFVADMENKKDIIRNMGVGLLVILLTATGIYDTYCVFNKNGPGKSVVVDLNAPVTHWIAEHAEAYDIFLTPPYTIHKVTMGGAMLYQGWPTFAWSAGYDTGYRTEQINAMYSANTSEELINLIEENSIRYIVVDDNCRNSTEYVLREDIIAATYKAVYSEGEAELKLTIYDTLEPLVEIGY